MLIFAALTALGLLQATAADGLPAPAAPAPKLSDIPGVTISYYDALGQSIPDLHAWLEKHGPRDALAHKVTPATSGWSIGSSVRFVKTGGQCALTGATVRFIGNATLPRLAAGQKLSPQVLARWNAYVAALEHRQAAQLAFVRDRLGEVQSAILRSDCANWQKAASAAIQRLSEEQAEAFKPDPKTQPRLLPADSDS